MLCKHVRMLREIRCSKCQSVVKSEISTYFYVIKVEQHHIKLIQLSYMQMYGYAKMKIISQCMNSSMCVSCVQCIDVVQVYLKTMC